MIHTPIVPRPCGYTGPMTVDALVRWHDQVLDDQVRLFCTNLQAAIDAGDLDPDDLDDAIGEATRLADEGRENFRRTLQHVASQPRAAAPARAHVTTTRRR